MARKFFNHRLQFTSYNFEPGISIPERKQGAFTLNQLSPKGQLFVLLELKKSVEQSKELIGLLKDIIYQVYYSYPSKNIIDSLQKAFVEANNLLQELLGVASPDILNYSAIVFMRTGYLIVFNGYPPPLKVTGKSKNIRVLNSKTLYKYHSGEIIFFYSEGIREVINHIVRWYPWQPITEKVLLNNLKRTPLINYEQFFRFQIGDLPIFSKKSQRLFLNKLQTYGTVVIFMLLLIIPLAIPKLNKLNNNISKVQSVKIHRNKFLITPENIRKAAKQKELRKNLENVNTRTVHKNALLNKSRVKDIEKTKGAEKTFPADTISILHSFSQNVNGPFKKWDFTTLKTGKYLFNHNSFRFLSTENFKRIFYHETLQNFQLRVKVKFLNDIPGRAGIIFNYRQGPKISEESFYSFSIFKNNMILLQKHESYKKSLLWSQELSGKPSYEITLICMNRKTKLFVDGTKILEWTGKSKMNGRLGLFADPRVDVEFKNIEIYNPKISGD